jgi:hypothetical protein
MGSIISTSKLKPHIQLEMTTIELSLTLLTFSATPAPAVASFQNLRLPHLSEA